MYENQLNLVICRKTKKYPHYLLLNSFEVNIFAPSIDTASYLEKDHSYSLFLFSDATNSAFSRSITEVSIEER